MAKTTTETTTKAATKRANAKTATAKTDKPVKAKRAPSAYNVYVGEHLKKWKAANPGLPIKDGMVAVAAQWRDAPENPNRGKAAAAKKPKADKENKKSKPAAKKVADSEEEEEEDDD